MGAENKQLHEKEWTSESHVERFLQEVSIRERVPPRYGVRDDCVEFKTFRTSILVIRVVPRKPFVPFILGDEWFFYVQKGAI